MARTVGFHLNRGVLAVADRAAPTDPIALARGAQLLAVTEGVNDHENLGSLFRNAAALGVDGVLLGPRCADPLYRRSVRVSMGHVLRVPFAELPGPWPAVAGRAAGGRAAGRRADPGTRRGAAAPRPGWPGSGGAAARRGGARVDSGRRLAAADVRVRIPMASGVDSLNVATAAAVAFHVARRSVR